MTTGLSMDLEPSSSEPLTSLEEALEPLLPIQATLPVENVKPVFLISPHGLVGEDAGAEQDVEDTPNLERSETVTPIIGSTAVAPATEVQLEASEPIPASGGEPPLEPPDTPESSSIGEPEERRGKDAINDIWMSRIARSERNADNPFVVGFCQNAEGKMQTIYGPRTFESRREVRSQLAFLAQMSHQKEVNLLETKPVAVEKPAITKGKDWDALPPELAQTFEEGKILVTTGKDHYAAGAESTATDTDTVADESRFSVLYYSDVSTPFGRTGVLMENRDGEWEPVITTVDEKEYIVELKGCGSKQGGFGGEHFRSDRYVTTGGIDATSSDREITNLTESTVDNGPKGAASITFDSPDAQEGERQGYVVRLSPSTVRASFTAADAYPDIAEPKNVAQVIGMKAELLAEQIFGKKPKIMSRSGHNENILLWGDGERTFTDFSDHKSLADPVLPTYTRSMDVLTPEKLVEYYASTLEEAPGFDAQRDMPHFAAKLKESFAQHGHEITIDPASSPAEIASHVWQNGLAYQTYRTRVEKGYVAEQIVQDVCQVPENRAAALGVDSEENFKTTEARSRAEMRDIAQFINQRRPAGADLLPIDAPVTTLVHALQSAPEMSMAAMAKSGMTRDQQMSVFGKLESYANLHSQFIEPVEKYFAHETDTLTTALGSCSEHERQDIESAINTVRQREEEFKSIVDKRPGDFYKLVTSPQRLRDFIRFGFYNRQRERTEQH